MWRSDMKELFNKEFFTYTEEACELSKKISKIITPIFNQYMNEGYNPIEIYKIIVDEIGLTYSEKVIEKARRKRPLKKL